MWKEGPWGHGAQREDVMGTSSDKAILLNTANPTRLWFLLSSSRL